jgi:hypothetical protein
MQRVWWLSLALVICACIPQAVRPSAPQVELLQFALLSLDPFSGNAQFDVQLRLTNPNSFALPLLDSAITAELGGAGFRLNLPPVELPASGGARVVPTRLTVPVVQGTAALASLVAGNQTRFRLLGELKVQLGPAVIPIGPVTLLDRNVQISLAFSPPALRITGIRLDGLSLVVGLEALNNNVLGFVLQGPLRLQLGGREVAQAVFNSNLAPGQTSQSEVRMQLSGIPFPGAVSIQSDLRASIPGIFDRPVSQLLQGILR